jgi:uncharacterized membrane protein YedE/YeeE
MNLLKFYLIGTFFGIVLSKGEVISWYRIQEMFRFQSFHMYGIIGTAVVLGIIVTQFIKRKSVKSFTGDEISYNDKDKSVPRYLIGGTLFGMGWALAGACPGPMFILLGSGFLSIIVVIIGGLLGTLLYGMLRKHLPH